MRTGRSVVGWVVLLVSVVAGEARAALITWEFEAVSRSFVGGPPTTIPASYLFGPGIPLRGSLTFDTETPKLPPGPSTTNVYPGAITEVRLDAFFPGVSGLPLGFYPLTEASFDPAASSLVVFDRSPTSGFPDVVGLRAVGDLGYGFGYQTVELNVVGFGIAQAGAPPLVPPALVDLVPFTARGFATDDIYSSSGLFLTGEVGGQFRWVDLELTSLRAVPEPAGVSLLALLALGGLCKRHGRAPRGPADS